MPEEDPVARSLRRRGLRERVTVQVERAHAIGVGREWEERRIGEARHVGPTSRIGTKDGLAVQAASVPSHRWTWNPELVRRVIRPRDVDCRKS